MSPLYIDEPDSGSSGSSSGGSTEVQVVNSTADGAAYSNGVEYVPLVKGAGDSVEFQFRAPVSGTVNLRVAYAMSAANSGNVRLRLDRLTVAVGSDPSASLTAGTAFSVTPGNDTNLHAVTESSSSDLALSVSAGDLVRLKLTRIADGNDTHTGDLRIITVSAVPA